MGLAPMAASSFGMRVWRKFARVPFIYQQLVVGEDMFRAANFWVRKSEREVQSTIFQNCQTLEDNFQFSAQMFGPHQLKLEILSFLKFAKTEQPKYVCEIGTADGGTNFLLSQALPSVRVMIGVDLYVKNRVQLRYFSKASQQISFINGSSYASRTVDKVRRILTPQKLDLLFIDGDHNYNGVKQDFLNYRHLVREGGLIVFHDIVPDYLTRYGIQTGHWVGGVPQFWSKIKQLYPFYEFVENPDQDGLGIGAIRYSAHIPVSEDL